MWLASVRRRPQPYRKTDTDISSDVGFGLFLHEWQQADRLKPRNLDWGKPTYWPLTSEFEIDTCHDEECPWANDNNGDTCTEHTYFLVAKRRGHFLLLQDQWDNLFWVMMRDGP